MVISLLTDLLKVIVSLHTRLLYGFEPLRRLGQRDCERVDASDRAKFDRLSFDGNTNGPHNGQRTKAKVQG